MSRRSTPAWKTDDARFPIRVKFEVPPTGLGRDLDNLNEWLASNVGSGRYAVHSAPRIGGDAVAVHLFNVEDARNLVAAFEHLPLAGGKV